MKTVVIYGSIISTLINRRSELIKEIEQINEQIIKVKKEMIEDIT